MSITADAKLLSLFPARLAYRYKAVPLKKEGNTVFVAMCDPNDVHACDDLRIIFNADVVPVATPASDIAMQLRAMYGVGAETVDELVQEQVLPDHTHVMDNAQSDGDETALVRLVNQIISEAHAARATDIHLEPFDNETIIRYRIDGVLHQVPTPASLKRFAPEIISRIKVMANMNIAERRLPQDGVIRFQAEGDEIDIRVSTLPVIHGESVDLRLLPRRHTGLDLHHLGVPDAYLSVIESLIRKPHGIVLVTGPTGHGKTTTLYACLTKINTVDKKIITVEEPVEYSIKGVNQVPVNARIGLTFAQGLRSILRQDPDVIMVGEIRDQETAEIAIRSSLTGHLVFSTLHTNDAPGAITRLIDMGIEPYLVASSVEAIIAQRLVRRLCPVCRAIFQPSDALRQQFGIPAGTTLFQSGPGCSECRHTGYHGRTGIYELLRIDEPIQSRIMAKCSAGEIKRTALERGMRTLRDDGIEKVCAGITSLDEVLRVTQETDVQ